MGAVIGIYSGDGKRDISDCIANSLIYMDDLGEDSSGISVARSNKVKLYKNLGTCQVALKPIMHLIEGMDWEIAIGHNRKSYEENPKLENAGPIEINRIKKSKYKIHISLDGCIVKYNAIREELKNEFKFESSTDTEVVGALFQQYLEQTNDFWKAGKRLEDRLKGNGYYSTVMSVNKSKKNYLVAIRSGTGTTPLCIGKEGNDYFISSESNGLDANRIEFERFVDPGEMIVISKNGYENKPISESVPMECIFRGIYFGSPDSFMLKKDMTIFELRRQLGLYLAKIYNNLDVDCVTYIPDTGKGVGKGYADGKGLDFVEGLKKNRHVKKTFNIAKKFERLKEVKRKTNPIRTNIKGKRLVVGEDSIVKGSVTLGGAVDDFRYGGASAVHLLISYGPIFFPCVADFFRFQGVAAWDLWDKTLEEICKIVAYEKIKLTEMDSVNYNTLKGLESVFGKKGLCRACIDGDYPVDESVMPRWLLRELKNFRDCKDKPYFQMDY